MFYDFKVTLLRYFIFSVFLILGCASVKSTDAVNPEEQMNQAYINLNAGRVAKAKQIFEEVITTAHEHAVQPLEARGIIGLADVYRSPSSSEFKELPNYKLSVQKYTEAAVQLVGSGCPKRAAMAYLGAAQVSAIAHESSQACEYYEKSASAYKKQSANVQDVMNPALDTKERPFLKGLADSKAKDKCN